MLFADFGDRLGQQIQTRRINPGHVGPAELTMYTL